MTAGPFASLEGKRFGVILADPPWKFVTWGKNGHRKSPERHYPTMTFTELKAMPVGDLAARSCALFLWVTWPILVSKGAPVHALAEAWGFNPSGLGWEWAKFNPETGKFSFGGGLGGTRKNVEPCLLYRRGNPRRRDASVRDLLFSPLREHSRKPDEQYDRIERLYAGPYVELFARSRRPGWSSWGNEVGKFGGATC